MPIPSEEQARAYYKEQRVSLQGSFSELKLQIMQYLQEQEAKKWFAAYADELRKASAVQIYLTAPNAAGSSTALLQPCRLSPLLRSNRWRRTHENAPRLSAKAP